MLENCWAIIRVYNSADSNERITDTHALFQKLIGMNIWRINVLIASDIDRSNSYNALKAWFSSQSMKDNKIVISECPWNQFTDLLNCWVEMNSQYWLNSLIISTEVWKLVTVREFQNMRDAILKPKIAVSCLAISGTIHSWNLEQTILDWRIANTCSLWNNQILKSIWWFKEEWNDWVEEIQALLDILNLWYKTAPIKTKLEYSPISRTEEYQNNKFSTKLLRQVNAYLLYLQKRWEITDDIFNKVYRIKQWEWEYLEAEDYKLRDQYEKKLIQILKNWVHNDYR